MASQFQLWDVKRRAPLGYLLSGPTDDAAGLDPIVTAAGLESEGDLEGEQTEKKCNIAFRLGK